MKIQLLYLFSFLTCLSLSKPGLAQKSTGEIGENGRVTKFRIEGNQLPCVGSIETYTIIPNPKTNLNTWEWEWEEPRAHAGDPPTGWEIISYSADYAQVTVRVGEKPGTIKMKPDPGASNTINFPVHPSQPLKLSISGPTLLCIGTEQVFRVNIDNLNKGLKNNQKVEVEDFTFTWELPAGLTVVNDQANAAAIKVKADATFKGGIINVKVSLVGSNAGPANAGNGVGRSTGFCSTEENISLPVNVDADCGNNTTVCPALEVAVTGPVTVCAYQNGLATYTANVSGSSKGLTYTWTLPIGWEISYQLNNTIQVRIGSEEDSLSAQSGVVRVEVKNTCQQKFANQQQVFVNEKCYGTIPDREVPIVLPVELVNFTAKVIKSEVLLEWLTASEKNNDRFEIERSSNGQVFVKFGEVKGHGTSLVKNTYSVRDAKAVRGINYYRLKQVDEDGKFTYSKVIVVDKSQPDNAMTLVVAPNPVTSSQFTIMLNAGETTQLQISNLNGNLVHSQTVAAGRQALNLNATQLQLHNGVYLLSVRSTTGLYTTKIIIR